MTWLRIIGYYCSSSHHSASNSDICGTGNFVTSKRLLCTGAISDVSGVLNSALTLSVGKLGLWLIRFQPPRSPIRFWCALSRTSGSCAICSVPCTAAHNPSLLSASVAGVFDRVPLRFLLALVACCWPALRCFGDIVEPDCESPGISRKWCIQVKYQN